MSERSERDTLRSVQSRIGILLQSERGHTFFVRAYVRFKIQNIEGRKRRQNNKLPFNLPQGNTVKRRLSKRLLSETSINRTLKETARACPSAIFCMFTIAASTVRNVRRLWKASEWLKNQRKKNRTVIFTEKKLRFVSIEEVELPLLLFQKILS